MRPGGTPEILMNTLLSLGHYLRTEITKLLRINRLKQLRQPINIPAARIPNGKIP